MTRLFPFDPSVAQALPALITIDQGGAIIRFTTWTDNVINGDTLYTPWPGSDVTGIQFPSDGTPANADVVLQAMVGSPIQPGDVTKGLLDNWPITIELFDPGQLNLGTYVAITGTIGSCIEDAFNMVTIACNGLLRLAAERAVTEKYSLTGREQLGDDRCKVPICLARDISGFDIQRGQSFVPPSFADGTTGLIRVADAYGRVRFGTAGDVEDYANIYLEAVTSGTTSTSPVTYPPMSVGDEAVDGTVTFVARNSWGRHARGVALDSFSIQFTALPDPRASDAAWYALGGLFIRSGAYSQSDVMTISTWNPGTLTATLFLPIQADLVPVNSQFEIYPGCDLLYTTCFAKFNNIANLRAEFMVPPPSAIASR